MQTNTLPQNHMEIYWHDYASQMENINIRSASLTEKASIIGRTGLMLLSCGTGGGHNAAGAAVQKQLQKQGHQVVMINPYQLKSNRLAGVIDKVWYRKTAHFSDSYTGWENYTAVCRFRHRFIILTVKWHIFYRSIFYDIRQMSSLHRIYIRRRLSQI